MIFASLTPLDKSAEAGARKDSKRAAQTRPRRNQVKPAKPLIPKSRATRLPSEPRAGDDPDGRSDWFMFQRTYPSGSIPADARLQAWQSRPQQSAQSFTGAASLRWRAIGPAPTTPAFVGNWGLTSGRINSVAVSPGDSRVVLVGSSTGGIWRSDNSGQTFEPVSDDHVDLAVGHISFSKSNPSVVYAGMGDTKLGYLGSGLLKSNDAGRTWARVSNSSLPSPGTIAKIEVDPSDANRLYVAQYSRLQENRRIASGIYVSTDGGVSFSRTLVGGARDVIIDPEDSRTLFAGVTKIIQETDPPEGVYRSTDRGSTWTALFTRDYDVRARRDFKLSASASTLYVYFGGRDVNGNFLEVRFQASTDGGATWASRNISQIDSGQFGYNTFVAADPRNESTVYLGSRDLYKSTDGGVSWRNITLNFHLNGSFFEYGPGSSKSHPDQHAFAFVPGSSNQFYIGNDGGLSRTSDGGNNFQSLNGSLSLTQFIGIALHPTDARITFGGTQDNGSQRRVEGTDQWFEVSLGDGGRCVINPVDPTVVFVTYIFGEIIRLYDTGRIYGGTVGWNGIFGESDQSPRINFYAPFTGNYVDHTLYFGTWRLFISRDLGNNWFAPAGDFDLTKGTTERGRDALSAISVARSNLNVIYTGSSQGRAMVSTDGGAIWSDITRGLPDRSITDIIIDHDNPSIAYLSVSGFRTGHVFKTTDMGATWSDVSGNLPDIPTNALLHDPANPSSIFAGTDIGVFKTTNGGESWRELNNGLPPVVVTDFASHPDGYVQLSTYGRGAYELLGNLKPAITNVTFDGKKKFFIEGRGFDDEARVIINGEDKSSKVTSLADSLMKLKGKAKKLGLVEGDNTVQIVNSNGAQSNLFTLRL
jgi:photosystem II stability/assembly factor-like uncharacterized protein